MSIVSITFATRNHAEIRHNIGWRATIRGCQAAQEPAPLGRRCLLWRRHVETWRRWRVGGPLRLLLRLRSSRLQPDEAHRLERRGRRTHPPALPARVSRCGRCRGNQYGLKRIMQSTISMIILDIRYQVYPFAH